MTQSELMGDRHIHRPQHRRSFEATHSLLLALIVSASRSLATEGVSYQGDFLEEMLLYYPDILLKVIPFSREASSTKCARAKECLANPRR